MDEIIDKIYHDPAGHGSMRTTYEDAKKKDQSITYGDIQAWFKKNIKRKTQLKGYTSFIANEPKEEYQMDLFFIWKTQSLTLVCLWLISSQNLCP